MSLLVAVGLGLLIGLLMGALGGGGAILTVPVLVYLLGQDTLTATTSSVLIVGIAAVFGTLARARSGGVDWRTGAAFGLVGIPAAYAGTLLHNGVDGRLLLLCFAGVMAVAAAALLLQPHPYPVDGRRDADPAPAEPPRPVAGPPVGSVGSPAVLLAPAPAPAAESSSPASPVHKVLPIAVKVVLAGLAVGFLTGLFGVGGGFLIVPALVVALRIPLGTAIGTSMMIIAVNAASALVARVGHLDFDWSVVVPLTIAAIVGTIAGKQIADRLPGAVLTRVFAGLLLAVAGFVLVQNLAALW